MNISHKVLFNVLKSIGTGNEEIIAPDTNYLKSLETIGLVNLDWDNSLTSLGQDIKQYLANDLEKF